MRCRSQPIPPLPRHVVAALPWNLQWRAALDGGRNPGPRRRRHDDHRRRLSGAESPAECHPGAVLGDLRGLHRRDVLHLQLTLLMTDQPLLLGHVLLTRGAAGLRLAMTLYISGCCC